MYLKKIEIQGFKSFANKTVFDFNEGITGIVGPNGSGKSNVSDAVRWVLGEQSAKQLRGGNMQDVIFAGTQLRKPQGFAYVALTLDNSDHSLAIDFDEVTVSRRLYRSGESEYMINGSICRMRDIVELFYDTGIGKEGYSIIGQGQVDKILSNKPEDRRELFDEAVGITKFKRRKVMTQKKLESEHANLVRITDILAELETRVGPLKRQSENAKEYLRLRDELKKYEVNLFLKESDSLSSELKDIEKNTEILSGDLNDANKKAQDLRDEYEDLETLIRELDEALNENKENIANGNIEIGELSGRINVLYAEIKAEQMNAEHMNTRLTQLSEEIAQREKTLEDYDNQGKEKTDAYTAARNAQDEAEKKVNDIDAHIASLEKLIEDSNAGILDTIERRAEINAEGRKSEGLLEQIQLRKAELSQKLLKVKSDLATLQATHDKSEKAYDEIQAKVEKLEDEQADKEIELKKLYTEITNAENAVNEAKAAYQSKAAKLESLKNIAERYEGYGLATRKVMDEKNPGVHGVVADIISSPKEYEVAIETALGARLQNVVTDTEDTAKKLIRFLKENKYGRVTFLPLTSIKSKKWDGAGALGQKGVIDIASNLVQSDEQYETLVDQLLGRIIIVDNIDNAVQLQKKHGYDLRIVTLDGEQLMPGGSISGGAFKNTTNLLSRKREVEELEEILVKADKDVKDAEAKLANAKKAADKKLAEIEDIKQHKQDALIERNTVSVSYEALKDRLAESTASTDDLDKENTNLENQLNELSTKKNQAITDVQNLTDKHDEYESSIADANVKLEAAKADREKYVQELSKAVLDTASHEQGLSFLLENVNRVKEEMAAFVTERDEINVNAGDSKKAIDTKLDEINENNKQIDEIKEKLKGYEEIVEQASEKKESKADEQRQFFEKRDAIAEKISMLDKDIFRLQNRKEKCEEKLDSQTNYIWNEYELTLETAEELRDDELGEAAPMKKNVDSLKSSIRGLGPVNVNAIDEYKEVSERYELMTTQHDDIVAAEEQLTKIIKELDEGMRKQFTENFAKIEKEFDKVFKELFGGGTGKLEIEEEEGVDILDAGIKIIAQPPGKKLQNMMQLSGGEKALTAICILFAIQNLRPSPFALLDEIEAALDDSNVDRFAHYLHRLSRNTQFIVITHRRGTMVSADRLYGITMQEKGVSTLVSVNLIEDELDN